MSPTPAPISPREFATVTSDDLVTGEGVALDLPPASLGLRLASGLIDVVATGLILVVVFVILAVATIRADEALIGAAIVLISVLTFAVYPTVLETMTRGRSLGKLALGLRTVRDDGGPISAHHALVRALIGFVEIYAFSGVPAFFAIMLSTRGKRLGDYAAGTHVVRDRVPLRLSPPPQMPPGLAEWARRADITALPPGLAQAVRQFLSRSTTIDPSAREQVARTLAAQMAPHLAPPPPYGAPPELVLAAVIAERRERDLRRLRRDAAVRDRLLG